jgi:methionyl-tRNA formyltransferase
MRVAILTANNIRHRYFVNAIREEHDVVAVCYEDPGYVPARARRDEIDEHTRAVVDHHFAERTRQEQHYFGHNADLVPNGNGRVVREVDRSTLNSADTVNLLKRQGVDVALVYGTDLIQPPLLGAYAGRLINMHLGLSPYYRGTATNFYPLLNDEPEYVGATIHVLDAGIDTGPILHHARPEIGADDMPHTVGCKAILVGIEKVKQALREAQAGALQPVPQWPVPNPKVYLRKHYHPRQVVKLYEMIEAGLFPRYVARKHFVESAVRLIP